MAAAAPPPKKVLFVLTSVSQYPSGDPTGYYLSEVVHPYNKFIAGGWEVDFASITGTATCDPSSVEAAKDDAELMAFWNDEGLKALLESPKPLAEVSLETVATDYEAIYYVGGYGCMCVHATPALGSARAHPS